ncbi:MAG: type I restriction endonuclease subunit R, partial [Acidimicrobiia bacterium]|nr:type I restriction endonuclease subunit R [Acidimicrobiia bacterium]
MEGQISSGISEGIVEEACLGFFRAIGYETLTGPLIGPDGTSAERASWADVLLLGRLRQAISRINPALPETVIDQVVARVQRAESQSAIAENERLHRLLVSGVAAEHRIDGAARTSLAWLVDWENPGRNDWLAVNQFTVTGTRTRRPDVVVF